MNLLIKNTRIVDEKRDIIGDLYIENGKIKEIGLDLEKDCRTIDGRNLVTMPSFVDLHVHLREPGFSHKEDIKSGSLAALKGGYTLVNAMANTSPIASSMEIVDYVLDKSKELDLIDIHQTVSITKDFDGETIEHLDLINRDKVMFISDDGYGLESNLVMYQAMLKAVERDFTIMTHAEERELTPIDYRMSENLITFRDIYLSQVTNARVHFSHVSTKEAIEAIRIAKKRDLNITCEVSPHHISLFDNDYRVNPPIRQKEDIEEIIRGIKDGTVDAIATDHAPHTEDDKKNGAPGMSGIELAFSIVYSTLIKREVSLSKISSLMSANPSRIFNKNKGLVEIGYDGDLVLLDLESSFKVDSKELVSKGKNTPYDGKELKGVVVGTIKAGELKYKNLNYKL